MLGLRSLMHHDVKRIAKNGQVSVGAHLGGQLVRMEPSDAGVFLRFVIDIAATDARADVLGAGVALTPSRGDAREATSLAAETSLAADGSLAPETDAEFDARLWRAITDRTWPLPIRRV